MKAVVVYESLWGNTAAIAHAIAAGIGPHVPCLCTDEADREALAGADLIVAGAPVLGFTLPTENMRRNLGANPGRAPVAPDLSHPSIRSWLASLPAAQGRSATFETRLSGPVPGSATSALAKGLEGAGYASCAKAKPFFVAGTYGPLRDGEIERARAWGAELAQTMG